MPPTDSARSPTLDPGEGLIQVLVEFEGGSLCQVVLALDAEDPARTRVGCSVESIGTYPAPHIAAVTSLVADTVGG